MTLIVEEYVLKTLIDILKILKKKVNYRNRLASYPVYDLQVCFFCLRIYGWNLYFLDSSCREKAYLPYPDIREICFILQIVFNLLFILHEH